MHTVQSCLGPRMIGTTMANNNLMITGASHSDYSLQMNRWFLKPMGAWPSSSSSTTRSDRIVSFVLITVCYCALLFTLIPCLLHIFLEVEDVTRKMKVLGPLVHWFVGSVSYTTLLLRTKDIRYCMQHIETDWKIVKREKDLQMMLRNAKRGRYVAASTAIFIHSSILGFCLVTALSTEVVLVGNDTKIVHQMPCAVYRKLIDVSNSPANEIVLAVQFLSGIIVNSSTVGIFSLAAVLAAHACGQLNILMAWITEFVNKASAEKKMTPIKEMSMIVEHHLRALSFISCIEGLLNQICFLELCRCTLCICIVSFYILTEWNDHDVQSLVTYFMMLVSLCLIIFMICYIGELLTEQCKRVGEVVYMTNWYCLPDKCILDLVLIIARSSVVVHITAGKLVRLSVYTFSDVVKTAFAYLNLLLQVS